ncbi:MAG: alanine racemase [Flavobacteriaceae bacterium]|nr:alanine racemase [Bacteroidia bacterium]MBT8288817.1 alanine racemase [Bacteroidia bacterium]NNF76193.1 alanine racemase [Flavobacteriaceae bacterium]
MPDAQETVLEINLNALKDNFEYLKSRIPKETRFLAVVKAFAYGHDAIKTAQFLEQLGVDYFAVAYTSEGLALRKAGIKTPILVLHPQVVNFSNLIEGCLEPSLYNANVLRQFIAVAEQKSLHNYPIHVKFNTGLNRLGFWENDVDLVLNELSKTKAVQVKSIFSHLAASEDLDEKSFSEQQIASFKKTANAMIEGLGFKPILHMCNTSGLLNFPQAHFDMVRSGIGLFGFGNSKKENKNLKPIASLKSVISQIHQIENGESVGYNRAYSAKGFTQTATIPIGHADGIGRQYGNGKGFVTIGGKKAPIIGNVCMDMIMVDITDVACKEGDEVIIFDRDNTAENFAGTANTISYELLTAISPRVKRIYIGDSF